MKKIIPLMIFYCLLSLVGKTQENLSRVEISIEINEVPAIKSDNSDFGALFFKNDIIFVSNRENDLVNWGEKLWHKKKYYNLFTIKDGKTKLGEGKLDIQLLQKKIFSGLHVGPISVTSTGDTMFYTQVVKTPYKNGIKKIYRPQLFMAVKQDGKWIKMGKLPFSDDTYSFAHPSFDALTQVLYFASDLNLENYGGTDIYSVKLNQDGTWGEVTNLGPHFNTASNESFPFVWHNKEIFFSSDKDGSLDIFWSWKGVKNEWSTIEKLPAPVNSGSDDFSIFLDLYGNNGFLSSDRDGYDQIYAVTVKRNMIFETNSLVGRFSFVNIDEDASGIMVSLMDEDGFVFNQTATDQTGAFMFEAIPYEKTYLMKIESESDEMELVIYDKNGKKITSLLSNKKGDFQHKKVSEHFDMLSVIDHDDYDIRLNQADFEGQLLFTNRPGVYPDSLSVYLKDTVGNIISETKTDKYGNFRFDKVNSDESYILRLGEISEDMLLMIYNTKDNIIAELLRDDRDQFSYRKINPDLEGNIELLKEDDGSVFYFRTDYMVGDVNHKKKELNFKEDVKIVLYNTQGEYLQETLINSKGEFRFNHIPLDESFLLKISEGDVTFNLEDMYITIYDRFGKKIAVLEYDGDGFFLFERIKSDQASLNLENDDSDELNLTFNSNKKNNTTTHKSTGKGFATIYFDLNSSFFNDENQKQVQELLQFMKENPKAEIEIKSYTDSRAPREYNLWLSERRTGRIIEFLTENGIATDRINGSFYGEEYLVNHCGEDVNCPEELHKLNRRSEILLVE